VPKFVTDLQPAVSVVGYRALGAWTIRNTTIANSSGAGVDASFSSGGWEIHPAGDRLRVTVRARPARAPESSPVVDRASVLDAVKTDGTLSPPPDPREQPGTGPGPVIGTDPPTDVDGDGLYEDVDGDGTFDIFDVAALLGEL